MNKSFFSAPRTKILDTPDFHYGISQDKHAFLKFVKHEFSGYNILKNRHLSMKNHRTSNVGPENSGCQDVACTHKRIGRTYDKEIYHLAFACFFCVCRWSFPVLSQDSRQRCLLWRRGCLLGERFLCSLRNVFVQPVQNPHVATTASNDTHPRLYRFSQFKGGRRTSIEPRNTKKRRS